ncbi:glycoside hydrolase domain-containing protein [Faecalibaculum rodentium]|nr:glycoside hydrolase domain-containing protein [Faecalibaculum rodentium]
MGWFQLVPGGDPTLRVIQRSINADWSSVIGVQPCEGVMSRNTALSLIGCLQGALNLQTWIPDLTSVVFGPATQSAFSQHPLYEGCSEPALVKIAKYALYFYGFGQTEFSSTFTSGMRLNVVNFQKEYGLTGLDGVVSGQIHLTTMMSLLTSRGNPNRSCTGGDTSQILSRQMCVNLKAAGYNVIGRYLTGTVGVGAAERPKYLTPEEIGNIQDAGLSVFPIYQNGGYYADYFKISGRGSYDAVTALRTAAVLGFPEETVIYFAVDFDCMSYQTESLIIPYFRQIANAFRQAAFNPKNYKIGIYGPREVCRQISAEGLAEYSFVADMSTGFSGNLGFPIPSNWAFDQFDEFTFGPSPAFPLDKVAVSGRDGGARKNDVGGSVTTAEMLQEARSKFTRRVLSALGFTARKRIDFEFEVGEQVLPPVSGGGLIVQATIKETATVPFGEDDPGVISINTLNGEMEAGLSETISEIQEVSTEAAVDYDVSGTLTEVAYAVRSGAMKYSFAVNRDGSGTFSLSIGTDDLQSVEGVPGTIGIEIELNIRFSDPTAYQWIKQSETVVRVTAFVTLFFLGVAQVMPGIAAGIGNFLLEHLGFLIDVPVFRK